ncbi:hypothetical protein OU997_16160 [Pseudomonas sp. SL4(2022)]|uniref:hypothetical protein n=1 Tax=Pseudomonas sp. SL4(2022) TaxID=2994661 RepID=UPI002271B21B|nr:hypothetical protein [Pseudomonas sp. SL4(2022)]WAC43769.1 hypothetical protein OU997_16160 [Pseudomonas sp. SL4(2022)]
MNLELKKYALVLTLLLSSIASAGNLHEKKNIHEDLIAAQELVALGCMGKLKVTPNPSGAYDAATTAKIQECADNEGSDIATKVLSAHKAGEIEKERMRTYFLHYSVMFAKMNNPNVKKMPSEELIKSAREQGRKHYPYVSSPD